MSHMFRIEKTNKKLVKYQFDTLADLGSYIEKNRYTQGYADLYHNEIKVPNIRSLYDIYSYWLNLRMKEIDSKRDLKNKHVVGIVVTTYETKTEVASKLNSLFGFSK